MIKAPVLEVKHIVVEEEKVEVFKGCQLCSILKKPMTSLLHIQELHEMFKARGLSETSYKAFHPLRKLRGHLQWVGMMKITKSTSLIHLNPTEGALIVYKSDDTTHTPRRIIYLN